MANQTRSKSRLEISSQRGTAFRSAGLRRLRTVVPMLLAMAALCLEIPAICFGQNTGGWTVEAPPNSLKLISVTQGMTLGGLKFTFENVSGKTIIYFQVGDLQVAEGGRDAFRTGGVGAIPPDATVSAEVGLRGLSNESVAAKELHVDTILYGDGSGYGFGPWKAYTEDSMLGEALEIKRDAGLLSASPDRSFSGLDKVAAQIRSQPLDTRAEAVQLLKGITLPGISQTIIVGRMAHASVSFRFGAHDARWWVLSAIANVKRNDAYAMAGPATVRQQELEKRAHALSDLAKKYSALSAWQIQYLKKVFKANK